MLCKVLSIDAWNNCVGCECPEDDGQCWTWNDWYTLETISIGQDFPDQTFVDWLIENGYLKSTAKPLVDLEDDGFNLVVVERENRRPLYTLEYGI